jgi:hypothetical protein
MVSALICSGGVSISPALAGGIALESPRGLTYGEPFRFVFNTAGRTTATSTDITTYDTFVNTQAAGATYNGVTVNWLAIGSTSSVNAIDHIGQTNTPVYLVDGTEVATSTTTSGLWSGFPIMHPINEDITGAPTPAIGAWTGTYFDGTVATDSQGITYPLGNMGPPLPPQVVVGLSYDTRFWVLIGTSPSSMNFPMYAISGVLTAVPEPSSVLLLCMGGVMVVAYGWTRRHRDRRQGPVVGPPDKLP